MKCGKASGPDDIAPEFVKYGGEELHKYIWGLFKDIWNKGQIPAEWRRNIIIPIHKKGSTMLCENYRAICLSSVVLKLFTRILEIKLRNKTERNMQEEQAAFRPKRQTQDHIFTLRTTIDKLLSEGRDVYMAFLDLTAAFDTIKKFEIAEMLDRKRITGKLRSAIDNVYHQVFAAVRTNGTQSEYFELKKGLKQGDSLSPLIFNLVMDEITKECNNKCRSKKTNVGHWNMQPVYIQTLTYADDIVIIADTPAKLQYILDEWVKALTKRGLLVNPNKSKILHVSKNEENKTFPINLGGVEIETVQEFKYLGTFFSRDGKIDREIKNRISNANNIYHQINRTLIGKREVDTKTKLQIYSTVYTPTLTYGAESWAMTTKIESQVTATEMRFLRRVAGKTRKDMIRNNTIREELGVEALTTKVEKSQLRWFGHVCRMGRERLPKKIKDARTYKRTQGRPRTTWIENISKLGAKRGKKLEEMEKEALDRNKWKKFIG